MIRHDTIAGPPTRPDDFMHDYQRSHPCKTYLPKAITTAAIYKPTKKPHGRPISGKHSEHQRAKWRAYKAKP